MSSPDSVAFPLTPAVQQPIPMEDWEDIGPEINNNNPQGQPIAQVQPIPQLQQEQQGQNLNADINEEGNVGGKRKLRKTRKTRKSRKSRKTRKTRKSRKSRKHKRGGGASISADQGLNQLNAKPTFTPSQ